MPLTLTIASPADASAIAALRTATAEKLTADFGPGPWSSATTEKGVLFALRHAKVFIAKRRGKIIATLTLTTKKPWAIDLKYCTPVKCPIYLTAMAVAPKLQRTGLGRDCLEAAIKICRDWPADAIRLDAYDTPAGAGPFYQKCGFAHHGQASYRGTRLLYYELLLHHKADGVRN